MVYRCCKNIGTVVPVSLLNIEMLNKVFYLIIVFICTNSIVNIWIFEQTTDLENQSKKNFTSSKSEDEFVKMREAETEDTLSGKLAVWAWQNSISQIA